MISCSSPKVKLSICDIRPKQWSPSLALEIHLAADCFPGTIRQTSSSKFNKGPIFGCISLVLWLCACVLCVVGFRWCRVEIFSSKSRSLGGSLPTTDQTYSLGYQKRVCSWDILHLRQRDEECLWREAKKIQGTWLNWFRHSWLAWGWHVLI